MTKDVLPESRSKSYSDQQKLVAGLDAREPTYEVPRTLDAAVCILARFASSKIRLFSNTYTRCQEDVGGPQVVVGGFAAGGLYVNYNGCGAYPIGIAALRKFF